MRKVIITFIAHNWEESKFPQGITDHFYAAFYTPWKWMTLVGFSYTPWDCE